MEKEDEENSTENKEKQTTVDDLLNSEKQIESLMQ